MANQGRTFEQFLLNQKIDLIEQEKHKYEDWKREREINSGSWLGWIFVTLFKTPLQDPSLWKGFFSIFKSNVPWEEPVTFPAFEQDHKRFDQLSNYYGNKYRGSFVFNYFTGALAVLAALVPVGFNFEESFEEHAHEYGLLAVGVELVMILGIWLIYKIGGEAAHGEGGHKNIWFGHRWHEKWLEYRTLAERFRYMEILYPLGIDPLSEGAAHAQEDWTWMNAYFAYRLSEVKTVRSADAAAYKQALSNIMEGQKEYHEGNVGKMERIHHRLHTWASALFIGTFLACLTHFVFHQMILTLLGGFLPALAAALHGILASGEFAKTARVSERMAKKIEGFIGRLAGSPSEAEVRAVVIDFHNIVIKDVVGWKAIFMDKNVPLA